VMSARRDRLTLQATLLRLDLDSTVIEEIAKNAIFALKSGPMQEGDVRKDEVQDDGPWPLGKHKTPALLALPSSCF